jgi:hypothetical protein
MVSLYIEEIILLQFNGSKAIKLRTYQNPTKLIKETTCNK